MPSRTIGYCYHGVDYSTPPHNLNLTTLADARNIVPSPAGLPMGRSGSVKLNSTAVGSGARVTSVHEFRSGTTRTTLCSYSTKVASYSSATGEFSDQITGLTDDKMFQWVNFGGKAIGVNEGSDTAQYYNASGSGDLCASAPSGLCVAEWANRVWFMDGATLKGSHLNDEDGDYTDTGSATNAVSQVVGDSGDNGIGLIGFFDMLLIGKTNQIFKLTGAPATDGETLSIEPLVDKSADNIGFTSPWAVTQVGNDLIFLDGYDIKRLSGITEYGDVETVSIIPHFRDFLKDTADQDYLKYTQFFHYKQGQQIWVSVPTGASTHYVFVLDYRFKSKTGIYSVYPMYNLNVVCFGGAEDGQVVDLYFGDESGFARQLDYGDNDDGSAIDRYFVNVISGNEQGQNGYTYRKHFQGCDTYIEPTASALSMTPYYATDLMDDSDIRTSANYTSLGAETVTGWGGTGVYHRKTPRFFGISGKTLALKWQHNTVAQNFTFFPSTVHYDWGARMDIE